MSETEFERELEEKLGNNYSIKKDENLIYKAIVDKNLLCVLNDPKNPTRSNYEFQTDLVIVKEKINLPLVVNETKCGGNHSLFE